MSLLDEMNNINGLLLRIGFNIFISAVTLFFANYLLLYLHVAPLFTAYGGLSAGGVSLLFGGLMGLINYYIQSNHPDDAKPEDLEKHDPFKNDEPFRKTDKSFRMYIKNIFQLNLISLCSIISLVYSATFYASIFPIVAYSCGWFVICSTLLENSNPSTGKKKEQINARIISLIIVGLISGLGICLYLNFSDLVLFGSYDWLIIPINSMLTLIVGSTFAAEGFADKDVDDARDLPIFIGLNVFGVILQLFFSMYVPIFPLFLYLYSVSQFHLSKSFLVPDTIVISELQQNLGIKDNKKDFIKSLTFRKTINATLNRTKFEEYNNAIMKCLNDLNHLCAFDNELNTDANDYKTFKDIKTSYEKVFVPIEFLIKADGISKQIDQESHKKKKLNDEFTDYEKFKEEYSKQLRTAFKTYLTFFKEAHFNTSITNDNEGLKCSIKNLTTICEHLSDGSTNFYFEKEFDFFETIIKDLPFKEDSDKELLNLIPRLNSNIPNDLLEQIVTMLVSKMKDQIKELEKNDFDRGDLENVPSFHIVT